MKKSLILVITIIICTSCQKEKFNTVDNIFPKYSGTYNVGTEERQFNNKISDSINDRQLNVQVWYPTNSNKDENPAPYISNLKLIDAFKKNEYLNLNNSILDDWSKLNTHANQNLDVKKLEKEKYPLIIFSHGYGMSKANYSLFCIELASNGYIVVSIDHNGSGLTVMSDGRIIGLTPKEGGPDEDVSQFCSDISFVITEIAKIKKFNVDENSVGAIGHSLGGAAALNIGKVDSRIKAAINLDGYLFGNAMKIGVKTPFLSILQNPDFEKKEISDSLKTERINEWKDISEKTLSKSFVVNINGLNHFDFSDLPFIIPDSSRTKNGGTLPPKKTIQILNKLITTFFDHHLKDKRMHSVDKIVKEYSEIQYEF